MNKSKIKNLEKNIHYYFWGIRIIIPRGGAKKRPKSQRSCYLHTYTCRISKNYLLLFCFVRGCILQKKKQRFFLKRGYSKEREYILQYQSRVRTTVHDIKYTPVMQAR